MSEFLPLSLEHKALFRRFLSLEDAKSSGLSFGNVFLWDTMCSRYVAELGGRLGLEYLCRSGPFFAFPIGSGELAPAVDALLRRAEKGGRPLLLRGITVPQRQELEAALPGRFSFAEDRDNFDYIYSVEAMASLSGKKLHGKRNHCNKFEALYPDWNSRDLGPDAFDDCLQLLEEWDSQRQGGSAEENDAIRRAFRCWESLELEGTVLYAGGQAVAFTVSERLTGDTMDVHFEKARAGINGAYPMIAREYARQTLQRHPEVRYLNREEDMGLENLRKAKQDWYPLFMVEKFNAAWRPEV